jgi:hypothetical protein
VSQLKYTDQMNKKYIQFIQKNTCKGSKKAGFFTPHIPNPNVCVYDLVT